MKSLTWHIAYCAALMTTFAGQIKAEETESTKEDVVETNLEERKTKALSFLGFLKIRGAEGEEQQEAEHVEVGNRSLSHAEWVKAKKRKRSLQLQEKTALKAKKKLKSVCFKQQSQAKKL